MAENSDANGLKETLDWAYGRLRSLVTSALVLLFLIGWAGFWIVVTRIHYLHQDWINVVLTTALWIVPVVGVIIWGTPFDGLGAPVRKVIDVLTPSPTPDTSGE